MSDRPPLDIDLLRAWIGRGEVTRDVVTARPAREFGATLDHDGAEPLDGAPAPLGVHWCLGSSVVKTSALSPDGHQPRGGFLPPVPLPRRMWAGGSLRFEDRLRVSDGVERRSRVAEVTVRQGRKGILCFVVVEHEVSMERGPAIVEQHDIRGLSVPMDRVTIVIDDATAAGGHARHAAELGFGGKLCIHPRQVQPVRQGFEQTAAEMAWATRIVATDASKEVAVGSEMLDAPVRMLAQRIVVDSSGLLGGSLVGLMP